MSSEYAGNARLHAARLERLRSVIKSAFAYYYYYYYFRYSRIRRMLRYYVFGSMGLYSVRVCVCVDAKKLVLETWRQTIVPKIFGRRIRPKTG